MLRKLSPWFILVFIISFLVTGCGGGGGGGGSAGGGTTPPPVTTVTLGGIAFDPADSALLAKLGAAYPALTLHQYGPGINAGNRMTYGFTYGSTTVGGVPGVRVTKTLRDNGGTIQFIEQTVFAKAVDGGAYIISENRGTGTPERDWVAGVAGAVPSKYILPAPATTGTYLGGYRQQYTPSTPGGSETLSTPVLSGNSPSALFDLTIWVNCYDGVDVLRAGDGIVEIDESSLLAPNPPGTSGWKAVIPAAG